MKIILSIIFSCIFLQFNVEGQTLIKDQESVYGKWTRSKSPYIITGEAIVPKGKKLVIQAGVEVLFRTGDNRNYLNEDFDVGMLRVNGSIVAHGSRKKMIKFSHETPGYWGSVYINNGDKASFKYCLFEYGYFIRNVIPTDNATGVLSFNETKGKVKHCIFYQNGWAGLNGKNESEVEAKYLTFYNNRYALEANSMSNLDLEYSILHKNKESFFISSEAEIVVSQTLLQNSIEEIGIIEDGGNIVAEDPEFLNAPDKDFTLHKSSPARKATQRRKNMGAL